MPVRKKVSKRKDQSFMRLTPFQRGMIYMGFLAQMTLQEISEKVPKSDGSNPSVQTVSETIEQAKANGGSKWNGVLSSGAGRPRETQTRLDKQIEALVYKMRGSVKVTGTYVQRVIRAARKVALRTIQRRIHDAGLRWLRRRRKTLLSETNRQARLEWSIFVWQQSASMLARWAFTDGTSFYLARTENELLDKKCAALGTHVWRAADGHDALFADCVGPSSYAKAQGNCVRIWGLLFAGILCVFVLPAGQVMNIEWYTWIIDTQFRLWLDRAFSRSTKVFLVQDHERCLWADEPLDALEDENIELLDFPKCSQDLNPIEVAWRELKARLAETMPTSFETRPQFVRRLLCAVSWVNKHRADYLWTLCHSQKAWAKDVVEATPPGARTKH